jgi:hypothetical protein
MNKRHLLPSFLATVAITSALILGSVAGSASATAFPNGPQHLYKPTAADVVDFVTIARSLGLTPAVLGPVTTTHILAAARQGSTPRAQIVAGSGEIAISPQGDYEVSWRLTGPGLATDSALTVVLNRALTVQLTSQVLYTSDGTGGGQIKQWTNDRLTNFADVTGAQVGVVQSELTAQHPTTQLDGSPLWVLTLAATSAMDFCIKSVPHAGGICLPALALETGWAAATA